MSKKTDLELLDLVVWCVGTWPVDSRKAYEELVRRMKKREAAK